ncbi:MAG: type II toxin-antitoxin system VapC family toxin [Acidobacteria bacterium]|jgi:predicted nucleic acid-binding protein|nr:type II toxin-antitoxin system VapC family toxin [Acidobacteriota bacterium]
MSRIYLDACIIIYIVEKHLIYSSRIETLMNASPSADFCYSPLARLECLVIPLRTKDFQLQKLYQAFFNAQKILAMPSKVFDKAAKLRADFTGLKTPDALHLAAVYHNCDEFWTNDNRLDKVAPNLVKNILTI